MLVFAPLNGLRRYPHCALVPLCCSHGYPGCLHDGSSFKPFRAVIFLCRQSRVVRYPRDCVSLVPVSTAVRYPATHFCVQSSWHTRSCYTRRSLHINSKLQLNFSFFVNGKKVKAVLGVVGPESPLSSSMLGGDILTTIFFRQSRNM